MLPSPPLATKIWPSPSVRKPLSSRLDQSLCNNVPVGPIDTMPSSKVTSTRLPAPTTAMPRGHFKPLLNVPISQCALVHVAGIACTLKLLLSTTSTLSFRHAAPAAKPQSCRGPLPGAAPPSTIKQPWVQSRPSEQLVHRSTPLAPDCPPKTMKMES